MNNYLKLYWYDILITLFLFFIGMFILSPFFSYLAKMMHISPYIFTPLSTISNYILVFIVYYLISLRPRKETFRINYSFNGLKLFPIIFLLFLGQYLISEFLSGLIPTQGHFLGEMYETMSHALLGNITKFPIITFISVCIVAPIFEELFFRGFILKGMLNNNITPKKAIVISALLFGGVHIFPWQVVGGISAGIILGLVFYKTGSLLICTLLHFINNLAGFLLFIQYKSLETPDFGINKLLLFFIGIIIVLIFGYLYIKFTKNYTWKFY